VGLGAGRWPDRPARSSARCPDSASSPTAFARRPESAMQARLGGSWLGVLPDFDDLHGVGATALADRLADGEDDDVAFLHHLVLQERLLGFAQELLAVVAVILDHQREHVAEERAAIARGGL